MNIKLDKCLLALCFALPGLGLTACSKDNPSPAESAVSAPVAALDTQAASASIAEARCAREDRCQNVGDDKKFSSTQDCLARVRDDWKEDLNARECPGGANEKELNECLEAVRNEDCASPFDTLSRVSECTAGQICVD